jgi:hypothetical protein
MDKVDDENRKIDNRVRSNQSLKLTEPAVDDLAARSKNF